jgi:Spy/CpxP family protein refolding chaperone
MEDEMNDPNRGTGRTTGLMLQALGNAALACGAEVEFVDHWPHTHHAAHRMERQIEGMAETLGLLMDVRRDKARVFVRSRISPNNRFTGKSAR